jgi:hypothetical protein
VAAGSHFEQNGRTLEEGMQTSGADASAGDLARMPDEARLWVFAAAARLSPAQHDTVHERLTAFVSGWLAHGERVVGACEIREHRFLLVAADENATGVSGCSIDTLFRVLKATESEVGISLLDGSRVFYRGGDGEVRSVRRQEFRRLAGEGAVTGDTPVFDNTIASVSALRSGEWERPARESWHRVAFGLG